MGQFGNGGIPLNEDATAIQVSIADPTPGANSSLDLVETSGPGTYVSGQAVTTGVDIILGNPGGAGNKIYGISIYNGSGQPFTACNLRDGDTLLDWMTLGMTTLASGSFGTWTPPGGAMESKNGPFKLRISCTGTMSGIKYGAFVAEGG